MSEILFTNVAVYDGGLGPARARDVLVRDRHIAEILPRGVLQDAESVVDGAGGTLMPGLVEAHAHFDFGASVGRIPANVYRMRPAERMLSAVFAARTLLDHGYTSAYSAGCFADVRSEIDLREEIANGNIPGPRMRACAGQWMPGVALGQEAAPFGIISRDRRDPDPAAARDHVKAVKDAGVDVIKFGLNGESGLVHGTTATPMFHEAELQAAMDEVHKSGLWASAHAYTDESVQMSLRHGMRMIYHCALMDESTIDDIAARRDEVFVAPGPGVLWATIHQADMVGFTPADIEKMEAVATLAAGSMLMPKLHERSVRVLPGGDYGFPWNPIGQNARDLSLFVTQYGYRPVEALHAATALGGELMALPEKVGRVEPGYLADILIVDGDPLEDVAVLQDKERLRCIMQGGRFHKNSLQPADAGSDLQELEGRRRIRDAQASITTERAR